MNLTHSGKGILLLTFSILSWGIFAEAASAQDSARGAVVTASHSGFGSGPIVFSLLDAARLERPIQGAAPSPEREPRIINLTIASRTKDAPPAAASEAPRGELIAQHVDVDAGRIRKLVAAMQ
jgi:hypothetical protein